MKVKKPFDKKKIILLLIVVIIFTLTIFSFSIKGPTVYVVGIEVAKIDLSKIEVTFIIHLNIENKNLIDATLEDIQAEIYTDGSFIGHAESKEAVKIPANSLKRVSVTFVMEELPKKIPVVEVRAVGSAHVKVLFWSYEFQFDEVEYI